MEVMLLTTWKVTNLSVATNTRHIRKKSLERAIFFLADGAINEIYLATYNQSDSYQGSLTTTVGLLCISY